jgi:protein TonB
MEIVFVQEKETRRREVLKQKVLTALVPNHQATTKKNEAHRDKTTSSRRKISAYVLQQGALTQPSPDYFKNPPPIYPAYAKEQGWEGVVLLKVFVGKNGNSRVTRLLKSSGYKILDQAAMKAVRQWKFLPARTGPLSFASWIDIPIRFRLIETERSLSGE